MDNSSAPRSDMKNGVVREEPTKERYFREQQQYGNMLKNYANGYEGYNPINFMHQLRANDDLMNQVATSIYQERIKDTNEQEYLDGVGLDRQQAIEKTKSNVRNIVSHKLYEGEKVETSISNHFRKLRSSQGIAPISGIKDIIESNPTKYSGFLDDNGEVEMSATALADSAKSDNAFYNKLMNDKFKGFNKELNKKNNQGVISPELANQYPDVYGKAFSIYDKYGSEGLTNYTNILQHYDNNKPYDEQMPSVKKGLDFMRGKDASGTTPEKYMNQMTDGIKFNPVKLTKNVPADLNNLNALWYNQGVDPKNKGRSLKSDSVAIRKLVHSVDEGYKQKKYKQDNGEQSWGGWFLHGLTHPLSWVDKPESSLDELEKDGIKVASRQKDGASFFNALVDGDDVSGTNFYQELVRKHSRLLTNSKYDGDVGVRDLMSTVQVYAEKHGGRRVNQSGDAEFAVDYKNAPLNVKYALDTLTFRNGFNQLFRKEGDNYILEPHRPERIEDETEQRVRNRYFLKGGEGIKTDGDRVPKDIMTHNILGGVANHGILLWDTLERFAGGELGKFAVSALRTGTNLWDSFFETVGEEDWKTTPQTDLILDKMYEKLRDRGQQYESQYSYSATMKATDYLSNFAYYGLLLQGLGRVGNIVAGKGLSSLGESLGGSVETKMFEQGKGFVQELRTAQNLATFKKFVKGPVNEIGADMLARAGNKMEMFGKALERGEGPVHLLDFSTGGAAYEGLNRLVDPEYSKEYSLLGSAFADIGLHALGYDTDLEGHYQNLDDSIGGRFVQFGMSVLADELLGVFMDGVFGAGGYAKNKFKLTFGADEPIKLFDKTIWPEKKFEGLHYKNGEYVKTTDKSQAFTSGFNRIKTFLSDGLDELPHVKFQEGIKNSGYQLGKSAKDIESVDGLVNYFADAVRPLVSELPEQVRKSTEAFHKGFGNAEMSSESLDGITDATLQLFWDKVAKGIGEIASDERYGQIMDRLGAIDDIGISKVKNEFGNVYMSEDRAAKLASEHPNYRMFGEEVDGEMQYSVLRPQKNHWVVDLVTALDRNKEFTDTARKLQSFLNSDRKGALKKDTAARDWFYDKLGKSFDIDGKKYTVQGLEGNDYLLEDLNGNLRRIDFDEVAQKTSKSAEAESVSKSSEKPQETNTPKSNDQQKTDEDTYVEDIIRAREQLDDGRRYIKEHSSELDDPDLSSRTSRRETKQKLTERLQQAVEDENSREVDRINNALNLVGSREKIGTHQRVEAKRVRAMDQAGVKKERKRAIQWMKDEGYDINYSDIDEVRKAQSLLNDEMDRAAQKMDFGLDAKETQQAENRVGELARGLEMLKAREKELQKGATKESNLSEGQLRWLEGEDGTINLWDEDAVESRLNYLNQLQESQSRASVEGYDERQVESVEKFLEQRLQKIRNGGSDDFASTISDVVDERKRRRIIQRRKERLKAHNDKFESQLKTIDEKLEKGEKKKYQYRVRKAKETDPHIEKTGVQKGFAESVEKPVGADEIDRDLADFKNPSVRAREAHNSEGYQALVRDAEASKDGGFWEHTTDKIFKTKKEAIEYGEKLVREAKKQKMKTSVSNVGSSRATDYGVLNSVDGEKRSVLKWNYGRNGDNGRIYYIQNEDGSIDHFIVNAKPVHPNGGIDDAVQPTRFIEMDGETRLNPYYRFISPNKLTKASGELEGVSLADIPDPYPNLDGQIVKYETNEHDLVANIQRPVEDVGEITKDRMVRNGFDAVKIEHNGETYYKLVSRDQLLERDLVGENHLLDTSKIETRNETPSYKAEGANPPKSYDSEGEKLADDMRSMGVEDEQVLEKIKDADFEDPVKSHRKELEPTWKDEQLEKVYQKGGKDDVLIDGEIKERSIRKDDGGYYVLANNQKHYVNRPRKGAILRSEQAVEKGVVRESEYVVGKNELEKSALEKGDLFSIRQGKYLRNGEVLEIGSDGSLKYSLYEGDGKTKNEYEVGSEESGLYKFYKPFAMSVGGMGVIALNQKLDFGGGEQNQKQAGTGTLTKIVLGLVLAGLAKKWYMKYSSEPMRISAWRKGFVESLDNVTGRAATESTLEANAHFRKAKQVRELGYTYDPSASFGYTGMKHIAELMAETPSQTSALEAMSKSKYIQSALSFSQESDSEKFGEIGKFLERLPREIKIQRAKFERLFNEKHGVNAFKKFFEGEGVEKTRSFLKDLQGEQEGENFIKKRINEKNFNKRAKDEFNLAFWRLMNQPLEFLEDGKAKVRKRPEWMEKYYQSGQDAGRGWGQLDEFLLNDPKTVDAIRSLRSELQNVERTFKKHIIREEITAANSVSLSKKHRLIKHKGVEQQFSEAQYKTIIDDFVTSYDGTWKDYVKAHDKDPFVKNLLRKARKQDSAVDRLATIRNKAAQYTEGLREHYWPQKFSPEKFNYIKQKHFLENPEYGSRKEALQAFNDYIFEDFKAYNDIDSGHFLNFDNDREVMVEKTFKGPTEAIAFLANIMDNAPSDVKRAFNEKFGNLSEVESGTNPRMKQANRFNRAKILKPVVEDIVTESGRRVTNKRWKLDPEQLKFSYGEGKDFDIVRFANADQFEKYYDNMMMSHYVKTSKFLENPRKYNMPPKYLETDVKRLMDSYSYDVGARLKLLEHDILDEKSMNDNWWNPARRELEQAGYTKEEIDENTRRMETAYRVTLGLNPEMANTVDKKAFIKNLDKWRQASEIYRNFQYGRYAQSIALLDTGQQFISTVPLTSFGSTGKANLKYILGDDNVLENFIENSRELGIVKGTVEDVTADINQRLDHRRLPTNWWDKAGNSALKLSNKFEHFQTGVWRWNGPRHKKWGRAVFENGGVRLFLDNAVGKNEVNLTANWIAHLFEARKISKQWMKIQAGEGVRGVTKGDVVRQFELLGVPASDIGYFAKQSGKLGAVFDHVAKNGGRLTDQMEPEFANMVERIMHTATENYHGKNPMHRSIKWHSPQAKIVTAFNNFKYNQGFQITQQRIRKPIIEWAKKYPEANKSKLFTVGIVAKMMNPKKRMKFLLKQGLSRQAIEDMPLHALSSVGRAAFATGANGVINWTIRSAKALLSYAALREVGWENDTLDKKLYDEGFDSDGFDAGGVTLNRLADLTDKVKLGDITDPRIKKDIAHTLTYGMGVTDRLINEGLDTGLSGAFIGGFVKYGSTLPAGLSMAKRLLDNTVRTLSGAANGTYISSENLPRLTYNLGGSLLPPLQLIEDADYKKIEE